MLELGQPLHAFDRNRIRGTLVARRARPGERITTLDGHQRELPNDTLVIADDAGAQAVAGVMGGLSSEVDEATRDVLLEAANFDRVSVRRASRALRLSTEASKRFERGLDPGMTALAAIRAAALIVELAGGTAATGVADAYPGKRPPREVTTTPARVAALLGRSYPPEEIQAVLGRLGFVVERAGEQVRARVPGWRVDVEGPADLAEEVARVTGYELIPNTLPRGRLPEPYPDASRRWGIKVRRALAAAGLQEVMTYSGVEPSAHARLVPETESGRQAFPAGPLISNPLSSEQSMLRTTLLPSLLATLRANLRHSARVPVFELARVYLPPLQPLPTEVRRLALAMTGPRRPAGWDDQPPPFDFFDLKGALEAAFEALGLRGVTWSASDHPSLHPGQAAELAYLAQSLGFAGQLHPAVAERFELEDHAVYVAELDFESLARLADATPPVAAPPRLPGVEMDISVVVGEAIRHADLSAAIRAAGAPLLESVHLFDVYRGAPIPTGTKSLAYALTYRDPDRTLTETEADEVHRRIEQTLRHNFGAQIRGR